MAFFPVDGHVEDGLVQLLAEVRVSEAVLNSSSVEFSNSGDDVMFNHSFEFHI